MHDMNIGAIDLNLLVALQALLTERHVTRAAARMGLTQPAMSHALARLRATLDDPLLVRSKGGLQLTPRATSMLEPLERLLHDAAGLLATPTAFDPSTSTRRFRIATSDYIEIVLIPKVLEELGRQAPRVDVDLLLLKDGHGIDALEEGEVDLLLIPPGVVDRPHASIMSQRVLSEKFVCVVRADHPTVGRKMTLERYIELGHILVSPRASRGGIVDDVLAKIGLTRRVAVVVPHFLVAPFLVEKTDHVLTLAARIAKSLAPAVKLKALPPPIDLPGFDINLVWHERDQADPAHAWLRTLFTQVAKSI
jgi:DNA-binding transcriptional LysR family regulator